MTQLTRRNAKGQLMVAIWAGPGSPPDSAYHSREEWLAQVDEMAALARTKRTKFAAHEVGKIWARWNGAPK